MRTIYCISGLGADTRMFDNLSFPKNYLIKKIEWLPFNKDKSFKAYVQRHIDAYQIENDNVIIGLSLGGIAASFIQEIVPQYKLIIVSSISNKNDLPLAYRLPGLYTLFKIISPFVHKLTPFFIRMAMKPSKPRSKELLEDYIKTIDHQYVIWIFGQVLHWKKKSPHENLIQIHGTRDRVFPYKNVSANYIIADGTHFMLRDKSDEISRILEEELE